MNLIALILRRRFHKKDKGGVLPGGYAPANAIISTGSQFIELPLSWNEARLSTLSARFVVYQEVNLDPVHQGISTIYPQNALFGGETYTQTSENFRERYSPYTFVFTKNPHPYGVGNFPIYQGGDETVVYDDTSLPDFGTGDYEITFGPHYGSVTIKHNDSAFGQATSGVYQENYDTDYVWLIPPGTENLPIGGVRYYASGGSSESDIAYLKLFRGKIYLAQIFYHDTMTHNLVPAKRISDNVYGLYDLIGGVFYTSATQTPYNGED